jgi:hypothetical protein
MEHALFALAYYVANVTAGRLEMASSRIRAYVGEHQREHYSMTPYFQCWPIDKAVRDRLLKDLEGTRPAFERKSHATDEGRSLAAKTNST